MNAAEFPDAFLAEFDDKEVTLDRRRRAGRRIQGGLDPGCQHSSGAKNANGACRRRECLNFMVGGAGFEPATPAV